MSKKSLPHLHYNDVQHYYEQAIAELPSILNIQKSDILTDQDVCEYLKSLLHMAALTAIKYDPELKAYYRRKKEEGKHTMLVLNNIKCKMVYRIFAVIARETSFVNLHKFAA